MLRNSPQHVCPGALAVGALICASAFHPLAAETQLVLVYNRTPIPAQVLAQAEAGAAKIFAKAGVQVRFVDCLREGEKCFDRLGESPLTLNVARDTGAYPNKQAMGFSAPASEGGTHAFVLYDRVERLATSPDSGATLPQILGHVIAHEIGHLLLSMAGHASTGLMHSPWSKNDMSLIARGGLLFSPQQAATMQEQLRQKTTRAAAQ